MPILKVIPQDMFEGGELIKPFIVVPSETVKALMLHKGNAAGVDAIGIANYLADKPEDWVIRRTDIMRQTGLGRTRYDRAVSALKSEGMWHVETVRNPENGRIEDQIVHFCIEVSVLKPSESHLRAESQTTGVTCGLDSHHQVNPDSGISDHLHKDLLLTQKHIDTHDHLAVVAVEKIPCTEDEFQDLCREILGGPHPTMWTHLARNKFTTKLGRTLSSFPDIRDELEQMEAQQRKDHLAREKQPTRKRSIEDDLSDKEWAR